MSSASKPMAGKTEKMGLASAVAIGVGGMVGGGIFSVLGLTVQISGAGAYPSFLVGGLVALLTGYSYAKLSTTYPSRGGTVTFINKAFGTPVVAGTLNVLLWLGYFVMLSLYAFAFGSYVASMFGAPSGGILRHLLSSAVVVVFVGLNVFGAAIVGKVESYLVYFKLAVLLFFVVSGLFFIDGSRVAPSAFKGIGSMIFAGVLIFVAYEGFELIANAAQDIREPQKNLPRAYYISIVFVIVLYVLVALVAVGNLAPADIDKYKDFALAAATRPFLGSFGFIMIGVAAAISTASAINSTLYGAAKFTYAIAQSGELPQEFERNVWNKPIVGLLATGLGTLVLVNVANLDSISTMGSTAFLLIFASVNYANYRLRAETGSSALLSLLGMALCLVALAAVIYYTLTTAPLKILVLAGMLALAFGVELLMFLSRHNETQDIKEHFGKAKNTAQNQ